MFSGAFLFRKAKIQKAIKQERWEKMDYQMFKEQLAALLKRKAGDDFEVKASNTKPPTTTSWPNGDFSRNISP